ncbi:MAG: hypothetical protein D4R73_00605 [Deltaproteobacteria bacterium]|nr:MAG: hypothetical protein D4R73_00605 [Deltaproteobacteria bacterium]
MIYILGLSAIGNQKMEYRIQESEAVKRETKDVRHLTSRIERLRLTADYGLLIKALWGENRHFGGTFLTQVKKLLVQPTRSLTINIIKSIS